MNKYRLKPSLAEKFNGIIWKIEIDDVLPLISVECRDIERHSSSFSLCNFSTGETLFKEISVEDGWNWGLDRVYRGMVFLHSYASGQSPEHKGIIAMNQTGAIEWQQFNRSLDDIVKEGLVVYNPNIQPKTRELEDPLTGKVIRSSVGESDPVLRDISVPQLSMDVAEIKKIVEDEMEGPVFYSHLNNKKIYAFHTRNGAAFNQQLLIMEEDKIILQDNLATDIQKLNPEAFFISRGHLFCIRDEKREIVSYLV